MTGHLIVVPELGSPEADRLIKAGILDMVYQVMAEHIVSGEHVWNPDTDVMSVRATADAEFIAEAEAAFVRFLVHAMRERAGGAA